MEFHILGGHSGKIRTTLPIRARVQEFLKIAETWIYRCKTKAASPYSTLVACLHLQGWAPIRSSSRRRLGTAICPMMSYTALRLCRCTAVYKQAACFGPLFTRWIGLHALQYIIYGQMRSPITPVATHVWTHVDQPGFYSAAQPRHITAYRSTTSSQFKHGAI